MIRLLNSSLSRLYKNAIFKICLGVAVFMGIFCPIFGHRYLFVMAAPASAYSLDYYFLTFINVIAFVVAAFCSFFIATDYNDGTIRNKIVIGNSRIGIYMANFITSVVAACILCTGYIILALCVGRPLIGAFQYFSKTEVVALVICAYLVLIAIAGITTLVGMTASNMVVSLGISACVVIGFLCFGVHQLNMQSDVIFWLGESKREMALFWIDFLPGGQMMTFFALKGNILYFVDPNPVNMIMGSLCFVIASTVVGMIIFCRKDLK